MTAAADPAECEHSPLEIWVDSERQAFDDGEWWSSPPTRQFGRCAHCRALIERVRDDAWSSWRADSTDDAASGDHADYRRAS